ncbi:hypothetical protein, partial [Stutzerimonas balearica]|uniref:hypothetical protein n=1 Tax=Stutzerimonas balearica TaxID=74829 RepID=UPI00289B95D9
LPENQGCLPRESAMNLFFPIAFHEASLACRNGPATCVRKQMPGTAPPPRGAATRVPARSARAAAAIIERLIAESSPCRSTKS